MEDRTVRVPYFWLSGETPQRITHVMAGGMLSGNWCKFDPLFIDDMFLTEGSEWCRAWGQLVALINKIADRLYVTWSEKNSGGWVALEDRVGKGPLEIGNYGNRRVLLEISEKVNDRFFMQIRAVTSINGHLHELCLFSGTEKELIKIWDSIGGYKTTSLTRAAGQAKLLMDGGIGICNQLVRIMANYAAVEWIKSVAEKMDTMR